MAAQRKAWHFDPDAEGKTWKVGDAELVSQLEQVLTSLLSRPITLQLR